MASPVEHRFYLRKATMDDIAQGMNPLRERLPDGSVQLFRPIPELQFRYKEKIYLNGAVQLEWSEWITIPLVKEGEDGTIDSGKV